MKTEGFKTLRRTEILVGNEIITKIFKKQVKFPAYFFPFLVRKNGSENKKNQDKFSKEKIHV